MSIHNGDNRLNSGGARQPDKSAVRAYIAKEGAGNAGPERTDIAKEGAGNAGKVIAYIAKEGAGNAGPVK